MTADPVLKRRGILVTRDDIPRPGKSDVTSVFNPGAVFWHGERRLLLRVQARSRETYLYTASVSEGGNCSVAPEALQLCGWEECRRDLEVYHVYDPRLTVVEDSVLAVLAVDTNAGCRLLTLRTHDFEQWDVVSLDRSGDRRNGVLFPARIGGRFARLERPNTDVGSGQAPTGSEVVLSMSSDLTQWNVGTPVFRGRPHYWDELIGPGTPPILTDEGWLLLYHGVATHFAAANVYQVGAVLLDRTDPTKVLGRTRENILEPRELYETTGQVPNVVFPSGWIPHVEKRVDKPMDKDDQSARSDSSDCIWPRDAEIDVYYGAADTCVAWATTTVGRLLETLEDPRLLSAKEDS